MRDTRCLAILLLVPISAAVAAPDDKVEPAKLQDKVTIRLGSSLLVQFEQKGSKLFNPNVVEKPDDKSPTPSFHFRQMGDNLMLVTKNPFPKDLRFRAAARLKGQKTYFETSIVPVKSGLFGVELWGDPIEELVLFDFELIPETCRSGAVPPIDQGRHAWYGGHRSSRLPEIAGDDQGQLRRDKGQVNRRCRWQARSAAVGPPDRPGVRHVQ
jgi:hypothetical protein